MAAHAGPEIAVEGQVLDLSTRLSLVASKPIASSSSESRQGYAMNLPRLRSWAVEAAPRCLQPWRKERVARGDPQSCYIACKQATSWIPGKHLDCRLREGLSYFYATLHSHGPRGKLSEPWIQCSCQCSSPATWGTWCWLGTGQHGSLRVDYLTCPQWSLSEREPVSLALRLNLKQSYFFLRSNRKRQVELS